MKILAVDYGDSRTGLATCDRTEFLTTAITPQITLKARNKVAARVCEVAKEIEAEMILIGLPLNMDGTEGERAAKSRKLAKTVELWSGLPVRMWDERQTTCAAADLLDESGTYGRRPPQGDSGFGQCHGDFRGLPCMAQGAPRGDVKKDACAHAQASFTIYP